MLRLDGENFGVTEENPDDAWQTVLSEEILRLASNSSFHTVHSPTDAHLLKL